MTLALDPGRRRHELALQRAALASDGMGGHTETWSTVATLFGRIEPVAARQGHGADQQSQTVTHRIIVPAGEAIAIGMRFLRQGRVFEITNVHDPDETGRYLLCGALERSI